MLRMLRDANDVEVLGYRGEAANEKEDRQWRRWRAFLDDWGIRGDYLLDEVPDIHERLLLGRGFVLTLRNFEFDQQGRATKERPRPMVSATIRDAIGCVASSFRKRGRASPFHVSQRVDGTGSTHPRIRALLKGFERQDPPTKKQKALTPPLLLEIFESARHSPRRWDRQVADLIIGGYSFAMRACEFCKTEKPGQTKTLRVRDIEFRESDYRLIKWDDGKRLRDRAHFVSITFTDQKNGAKMEKRSHSRSGKEVLCPVRAWVSVISRIRREFGASDSTTYLTVCTTREGPLSAPTEIKAKHIIKTIREACGSGGAKRHGINRRNWALDQSDPELRWRLRSNQAYQTDKLWPWGVGGAQPS